MGTFVIGGQRDTTLFGETLARWVTHHGQNRANCVSPLFAPNQFRSMLLPGEEIKSPKTVSFYPLCNGGLNTIQRFFSVFFVYVHTVCRTCLVCILSKTKQQRRTLPADGVPPPPCLTYLKMHRIGGIACTLQARWRARGNAFSTA